MNSPSPSISGSSSLVPSMPSGPKLSMPSPSRSRLSKISTSQGIGSSCAEPTISFPSLSKQGLPSLSKQETLYIPLPPYISTPIKPSKAPIQLVL